MIWFFLTKQYFMAATIISKKSKSFGYFVDHQAFVCLKKKRQKYLCNSYIKKNLKWKIEQVLRNLWKMGLFVSRNPSLLWSDKGYKVHLYK